MVAIWLSGVMPVRMMAAYTGTAWRAKVTISLLNMARLIFTKAGKKSVVTWVPKLTRFTHGVAS